MNTSFARSMNQNDRMNVMSYTVSNQKSVNTPNIDTSSSMNSLQTKPQALSNTLQSNQVNIQDQHQKQSHSLIHFHHMGYSNNNNRKPNQRQI